MHGLSATDERWELYKVLADPQRLRLLALAAAEELAIGELAELLDESQPNVSRQLAPLRRLGLLSERKQGTRVFIRLAASWGQDPVVRDALASGQRLCAPDRILERVPELVRRRDAAARAFFGQRSQDQDRVAFPAELPAYLAAVATLIPNRRLAVDLGTGDGRLLEVLAPLFEHVVGVDRETAQLERASKRLAARGYGNVALVEADLQEPSVLREVTRAGLADVVFASRLLHHAPRPAVMMAAMAELLAPQGVLIVIDYAAHADESLREEQADLWLGFSFEELLEYAAAAGLHNARIAPVPHSFCGRGPDAHLNWQVLSARRTDPAPASASRRISMETTNG